MKQFVIYSKKVIIRFLLFSIPVGLTVLVLLALISGGNTLAASLSTGIFTDSGQMVGDSAGDLVALSDLDGDNDLDAVVADQIWMNDGLGIFMDSGQHLGYGGNELATGDVDGDQDLDIVLAVGGSEPNTVWLNDGNGIFSNSGQSLGARDSWALALGDVDGDKDLDVLFANSDSSRVWLNNGSGIFTDSNQDLGSSGLRGVALQDLDGDMDLDAFFADCTVWLNNGSGTFSLKSQSLCPSDNVSLAMGDVDGDTDIDAFIGNATKHPNLVYLNDGAANFTDSGQTLGDSSSESIALGDIDGDNDLDAFVANTTEAGADPANKVWLNNGSGTFNDSGQNLDTVTSTGVVLGDVDKDTDLDALVGNTSPSSNSLYWNGTTWPRLYLPVILK